MEFYVMFFLVRLVRFVRVGALGSFLDVLGGVLMLGLVLGFCCDG